MKKLLGGVAVGMFCFMPMALQAASDGVQVAILHGTFKKDAHSNEFDSALKELGWKSVKYKSTGESMSKLTGELKKYDMVVVCPLFNYYTDPYLPVDYAPALARYVREGGALVLTDAIYESHIAWLPVMDPGLTLRLQACNSSIDAAYPSPALPYNSMPNILRIGRKFSHYILPRKNKWEVVARCGSHGAPAVVAARLGKGFVYATTFRQPNPQFLENMLANIRIQRMGLAAKEFTMPRLTVGRGEIKFKLKNTADTPVELSVRLSVAAPAKPSVNAEEKLTLQPGKEQTVSLPYDIPLRGKCEAALAIVSGEKTAQIFKRPMVLPDLLAVHPPRYRGIAVTSEIERAGGVKVIADIVPYREKMQELRLKAVVRAKTGEAAGKTTVLNGPSHNNLLSLNTGKLTAGSYTVEAELLDASGKVLAKKSAPFQVLDASKCPVFINDDMNLVVDGKPFFPIGIYHISRKEFQKAAELGFNTLQVRSWEGFEAVDLADKLGIKVLWEQNHRNHLNVIRVQTPKLINKRNLLAWYAMDEPFELEVPLAKAISKTYHEVDKGRPTFMVSCTPVLFDTHAETADIMAVDPYPYPSRPITMVADWIDRAWKATKGNKPVVAVPQSFGGETPEALRAMAYLAIIHEARGIIWYPWDDGKNRGKNGGVGLKYAVNLHPVMKQLVSEIKVLSPALLNKTGRRQIKSADGMIHGLLCADPAGKEYLLLVNPHKQPQSIELKDLPELTGKNVLREQFGSGSIHPGEKLTLKPFETKAYAR